MSVTPPAPLSPLRPQYVRLHDGRALAYLDVGPRDAPPVMHFHGIPCSRLEALWEADSCHELGVRVICPDRPGYGLSDYLPDRSLLDWPADVTALADALGLGRFGVVGVSGGGPYALACAFAMPDRLTGVCVVSGVGRLHTKGGLDGVDPFYRLAFRHVRTRPWIARTVLRTNVAIVKMRPSLMRRLMTCPPDLAALRSARPEITSLGFMAESVHRGLDGPVRDAWILAGAWGFEPEDVTAEVHLWHGDTDPTIPLRHSEELATLLPHLRVCPGEGHLLYAGHLAEIMAAATGA
jgi:pimeloyl-ACP methyl ester carboxylesterase